MVFTDEFIEALKSDPVTEAARILELAQSQLSKVEGWQDQDFAVLVEAYALAVEIIDAGLLPIQAKYPPLTGSKDKDCPSIYQFLEFVHETCIREASKLRVKSLRSRFRASLGTGFVYEFSQGDLERAQHLINELREQIAKVTSLDHEHQQRLLRRLEKLQSELHKRVSDLDRFWGLIGDAGVVLGKLGNEAKPIVDRIREIADIVWQTQSRAEELPSGTRLPSLENKPTAEPSAPNPSIERTD